MSPRSSRRALLGSLGASLTMLAGCTSSPDDPPPAGVDSIPEPDDHIYGADGEWGSFGSDRSHTRQVSDGKAPVDGVTEKWRVEVPQLTRRLEPLVANDVVYHVYDRSLHALDAADGSVRWRLPDVDKLPLVTDGTAYVPVENRLLAVDPQTGDQFWERELPEHGHVGTPVVDPDGRLFVPEGETLFALDRETGETAWSRRLFGPIVGPPVLVDGWFVAVVTEARKLFLLEPDGTGAGEWTFPARPQSPPTADTDGIYCNFVDGMTRGIRTESSPRGDVDWQAETGWNNGGLAVKRNLYAAGTRGLAAIDPETGSEKWTYETGNWRHTAPVLARDTLFVGGDKLYALDPTPSGGVLDDGPATRWTKSFHGEVGPGPVIDDGVIYTVAETGEETYHLLALS
ncbi:PQQ-binding-like beta-propeller repeat protein [Haloarchaeobius sp. DYHT-AS-18]|uniref:outer membrane protein assembly factor BamB family protein n=1 Tax=Haloarchaeobius sp. DYHT-AS-18 TaxID=3446117 RepID=UPI003EBA4AA7